MTDSVISYRPKKVRRWHNIRDANDRRRHQNAGQVSSGSNPERSDVPARVSRACHRGTGARGARPGLPIVARTRFSVSRRGGTSDCSQATRAAARLPGRAHFVAGGSEPGTLGTAEVTGLAIRSISESYSAFGANPEAYLLM
uniref:Uncharacterized protein n=1 Tax=Burkholderia sp. M701 TaxID=326454 RepID=V5YMP8_9BURK|nr:hypothetical protein [Burkholderia sp. M701]